MKNVNYVMALEEKGYSINGFGCVFASGNDAVLGRVLSDGTEVHYDLHDASMAGAALRMRRVLVGAGIPVRDIPSLREVRKAYDDKIREYTGVTGQIDDLLLAKSLEERNRRHRENFAKGSPADTA